MAGDYVQQTLHCNTAASSLRAYLPYPRGTTLLPIFAHNSRRKVATLSTTAPRDANSYDLWKEGAVIGARESFIGFITDSRRHRNNYILNDIKTMKA
jgi:hypothetical protein